MSMRIVPTIAMLACVAAVSPQVSAGTMGILAGFAIKDSLVVGEGQARVTIPLPSGEWQVFRADEQDMRMLNPINQNMAPVRLDIFLTQRVGSRIAMTIRIEASKNVTPNSITSLSVNDPCKRTDTLYRNAYDSGGAVVNCLLINHVVGYLRATGAGLFPDLNSWMTKEGLEIPRTAISATIAQSLPGRFLTVTITVNPALRELDSGEPVWRSSPFHRDRIGKDTERDRYVRDFIAWAEAYKSRIPISQRSGSVAVLATGNSQVPAFPSDDDTKTAEAKKKAAEETRKLATAEEERRISAADEARKHAAVEEEAKRVAVAEEEAKQAKAKESKKGEARPSRRVAAGNMQEVDFEAEANKAARILGCQPLEVKVIGAEGGNIQYRVACAGSSSLLLSCDSSGLCLQKKPTTNSRQ